MSKDISEDSLQRIGSYKNKGGDHFTMHRSPNDKKHLFLIHKGRVVDYHHGSSDDFHKKVTGGKHGLTGYVHEEAEQIDEISKPTLKRYVNKAATRLVDHGFDMGAGSKEYDGHPRFKKAEQKANRRRVGIKRAVDRIAEEVEQIDELSTSTLTRYAIKAGGDRQLHSAKAGLAMTRANAPRGEGEVKTAMAKNAQHHARKAFNRAVGMQRATSKLVKKPETAGVCEEVLNEATLKEVSKKLEHHGYKKFGDSDRIDHKEILTTFHHPDLGHLVSVNHRETGKVNSASAMKCTNPHTGEMAPKWGEDHSHVELALRELGHKSYVGFKEEIQLDEISAQTLRDYEDASDASAHSAKNKGDQNTLRKRRAGAKMLSRRAEKCEYCGGSGVGNHGVKSNQELEPCEHCDGRGHVFEQVQIDESKNDTHEAVAKQQFNRLKGAAGTIGSHRGMVRVYYDHKGGQLQHTMVGEVNHYSYGTNKSGHHFASRYSARPGHEVHTYAHFPQETDFRDHEHIHKEVERQNPHTKGTGHARNLSHDIIKYHGDNNLIKEEVEQVDEVSNRLRARYVKKAVRDKEVNDWMIGAVDHAKASGDTISKAGEESHKNLLRKNKNRSRGIDRALTKLGEHKEAIAETIRKKGGRPKKARHEDGEIVNDPNA